MVIRYRNRRMFFVRMYAVFRTRHQGAGRNETGRSSSVEECVLSFTAVNQSGAYSVLLVPSNPCCSPLPPSSHHSESFDACSPRSPSRLSSSRDVSSVGLDRFLFRFPARFLLASPSHPCARRSLTWQPPSPPLFTTALPSFPSWPLSTERSQLLNVSRPPSGEP